MASLTHGTHWSVDPTGQRDKTEPAALLYGHGQSSPTANLPAVTSSRRDLLDLAHLLNHLAGPIVDVSDNGGSHGGAVALDDGATLVEATVARSNATPSITELRRS